MDKIFTAYDKAKSNTLKGDFIDRLHSKHTVVFLFLTCIIIGLRQYDDKAIVCWLSNQLSDDQVEYTHQLCWVNSTFYYPDQKDGDKFQDEVKHVIPYYQFILFILFAQAILFYFPTLLGRSVIKDSHGYITKLLDQVEKSKQVEAYEGLNNRSVENSRVNINKLQAASQGEEHLKTVTEEDSSSSSSQMEARSLLADKYSSKFKGDFQGIFFLLF